MREEARITLPDYAKVRDRSRPHYSRLIVSNDVSSLFCKHKFLSLTDKCRRHTRRIFAVLKFTEKLLLTNHWQFCYLSKSIGWMARRVRD
jgi:hypothetical protein